MNKLIFIALAVIIMAGCSKRNPDGSIVLNEGVDNPRTNVIDSCEYINWGYGMAHKGNCKYCAERRQKELEELVKKLKEK